MDIAAIGSAPQFGKPELMSIREVYKKNSQFTTQIIRLQFPIAYSYGEEAVIDLYQEGDIINDAYLSFVYPSGQPSAVVNSFGTYILNWAQLEYGDQIIERIDGEFLEMMNDITVPQAKQGALSNLTGKYLTSNLATYNVKLNFSMFKKGLPVCALKENPRVRISLRNFKEGCPTASNINPLFKANLFVQYIFLPESERDFFIKNELTYLFEQTQVFETRALSNCTVYTDFQNSTKELFVVIKGKNSPPYSWADIISLRLLLNNSEVITHDLGTSLFLKYLQPLENHTRAPDRSFYSYSFALDPENDSPTGTINLSGIKQQFDLVINPIFDTYIINIYSRTYNILKIKNGYLRVIYPVPFLTYGDLNVKKSIPDVGLYVSPVVVLTTYTSSVTYTIGRVSNPFNLPIIWTYPTLTGVTWSYTNYDITLTVAQNTLLSATDITITATSGVKTYSQNCKLTFWYGFTLQPVVGRIIGNRDLMIKGIQGTNTTTGINYFDTRDIYETTGPLAIQDINIKIVASVGNILTFNLNIFGLYTGLTLIDTVWVYYNSAWVIGNTDTFVTGSSTTARTVTYTVPSISPGIYSLAFVAQSNGTILTPDINAGKKVVIEYVLQIV
jgi:hypothetical protein